MSDSVEIVSGESGDQVTYVGGKAVEQTTGGDSPDGDHGDEVAAAKAAVKKVLDAEAKAEAKKSTVKASAEEDGKKAAREAKEHLERDVVNGTAQRGADGKFLPKEPTAKTEDDEPEAKPSKTKEDADESASALKKALNDRRELARLKEEAKAETAKIQAETRALYQQLEREKREVAEEKARFARLRTDPVRAIKENGWNDPEAFILDIAESGTPEGQARRQQRELESKIAELNEWKASMARQEEERRQEQEVQARRQHRQNVERQFLQAASKHDALVGMWKGHEVELIAQADIVAEKYRAATGKEATFDELAEYLAEIPNQWYRTRSKATQLQDAPAEEAVVTQGTPTQGKTTGVTTQTRSGKSLSPAGSGERRTLGNNYKDLEGDERLEAAKAAVRSAIAASGGR